MENVLGINKVGIIQAKDGRYLCWDNSKGRLFLSNDINQAHIVLGNRELNANRIIEMFHKTVNPATEFSLTEKLYCLVKEGANFFIEKKEIPVAYLYETEKGDVAYAM